MGNEDSLTMEQFNYWFVRNMGIIKRNEKLEIMQEEKMKKDLGEAIVSNSVTRSSRFCFLGDLSIVSV